MARADEFLALLDNPSTVPPKLGDDPADELLLAILVQMACSDGVVQEEEFWFFKMIMPDKDETEILLQVSEMASKQLKLTGMKRYLPGTEDRVAALRFAARLAWADRLLDEHEKELLTGLALALDLDEDDVERALDEVVGMPSGAVSTAGVQEAVGGMIWRRVQPEEAGLFNELKGVVPGAAQPVARLLVDGIEQVGLYDIGLAARFEEGPRFVAWDDVSCYTRVPVLGATLRVMLVDGTTLTVADPRLQEVGSLLDRVYTSE